MSDPTAEATSACYVPEFGFAIADPPRSFACMAGPVESLMGKLGPQMRGLDVGCGISVRAGHWLRNGCGVVQIGVSDEGIAQASKAHPNARFVTTHMGEFLNEKPLDIIVSAEVVEHLYAPREWAACVLNAIRQGGGHVCSTPHHGYVKELVLRLSKEWDAHLSPLWDGGHIKVWSRKPLDVLPRDVGFVNLQSRGAGRAPLLWMSMVMSGDAPARLPEAP